MPTIPAPSIDAESIAIRPARPDDSLCLSVLATQVFLDTYATEGIRPSTARKVVSYFSESVFSRAVSSVQSLIAVAERAERLLGFVQVTVGERHQLAPAGQQAELLRLYVQAPLVGRGVGTRLLAHAEHSARQAGVSVMWLTPWVENRRALEFYVRRGYRDFGLTHSPSFEGTTYENRVYAKHLASAASLKKHTPSD